ncbi:MAG: PorT family protein [Saprospiraceae bacterium]|nr:PorT family protein [Saprospiraceae bacterium]
MRLLTVLLLSLVFSFSLKAQKFMFGPELGLNIMPTDPTDIGREFLLGTHAGMNASYAFGTNFSIASGIFYTLTSKQYERHEIGGIFDNLGGLFGIDPAELLNIDGLNLDSYIDTEGKYNLSYLQMPLLAQYNLGNFQIFLGPYASFLVGARSKELTTTTIPLLQAIDISTIDPDGNFSFLIPPAVDSEFVESSSKIGLNRFDYGATAGFGYSFDRLQLRLSYSYGLEDYVVTPADGENATQQFFRIGLTYQFVCNSNPEP